MKTNAGNKTKAGSARETKTASGSRTSGGTDVLVFGAHADDIELSSGATIVSMVADGLSVGLVDLTHGEMGTRGTPRIRLDESAAAMKVLGAAFRERLDFGDGGLRTGRDEEMQLVDLIRRHRPRVVIAPWPDDRHPDHTRAGTLITEAAFYSGLLRIKTDLPAHRPQVVLYYILNYAVMPSFIVDVTASWNQKMKAVSSYESQFFNASSNEPETFIARKSFLAMIEARGRHYGSMIGAEFGEPYVSKQPPKIRDVVAAYSGREVG